MKLHAEPRLNTARPRGVPPNAAADRAAWLSRAVRVDDAPRVFDTPGPIIATGHQAWLWHPGILAKDIAAVALAQRERAIAVHLVVDHDPHDCFALDVPSVEGDRLSSRSVHLAACYANVPPCCQPAAEEGAIARVVESLGSRGSDAGASLASLSAALRGEIVGGSLGRQVAVLTARLMRPWVGAIPMVFSSDIALLPGFATIVRRMLADARRCVLAYNRAASRFPDARIAPLAETLDRVEFPLWHLRWGGERERVYADLADHNAILTLEDGTPIDIAAATRDGDIRAQPRLAPRALLMTALLRSLCCDLFIHGKGGGLYDRVTEAWWSQWAGESLAPMSVVSADVHMPFTAGVPITDRRELERAVWWRHHLPHNLDRVGAPTGDTRLREWNSLVSAKHATLAVLSGPRDRVARAKAFADLHRINAALAAHRADLLKDADTSLARARAGVENARIAERRDWSFALYPPAAIDELARAIREGVSASA